MGIEYTGVFEMLGNGMGFGLLFGAGVLAALWGVLYILDRIFPEKKNNEASTLRLLDSDKEALPAPQTGEHRKAA